MLHKKTCIDCGTQTDPLNLDKSSSQDWDISNNDKSPSIVDQVKQVAESALLQTGFVYEETSGMYYDYNTGYYYDTVCIIKLRNQDFTQYYRFLILHVKNKNSVIYSTNVILKRQGLYYNGNTGTYYYYDEASKTYQFHSQVQVCTNEATNMHLPVTQKREERNAGKVDKVTVHVVNSILSDIYLYKIIFDVLFLITGFR